MKKIILSILCLLGIGTIAYGAQPYLSSFQLAPTPINGKCLFTNGANNYWDTCITSGSASTTLQVVSGGLQTATSTDFIKADHFIATSTTASSTFNKVQVGGFFHSTSEALFSGATTTFNNAIKFASYGATGVMNIFADNDENTGIHFDGPDTLSLHSAGNDVILLNSSGFVGVGTNTPMTKLSVVGTTTMQNATITGAFNMMGQFFDNLVSFVTYIQTLITENITGLNFSSGVLSLDSGYEITKTASSSNWNGFWNTPSTRINVLSPLFWDNNEIYLEPTGENGAIQFNNNNTLEGSSLLYSSTSDTNIIISSGKALSLYATSSNGGNINLDKNGGVSILGKNGTYGNIDIIASDILTDDTNNAGTINITSGNSSSTGGNGGDIIITAGSGDTYGDIKLGVNGSSSSIFDTSLLTDDRRQKVPNKDGTFAMLDDIAGGVTTLLVGNGFLETATTTDYIKASYFTATSTTATSTFPKLSITSSFSMLGQFFADLASFVTYINSLISSWSTSGNNVIFGNATTTNIYATSTNTYSLNVRGGSDFLGIANFTGLTNNGNATTTSLRVNATSSIATLQLDGYSAGDLGYYDGSKFTRVPGNTDTQLKFLSQFSSNAPTWQNSPSTGSFTYFYSSVASTPSPYYAMDGATSTVASYSTGAVSATTTLNGYITKTGGLGITTIPAGIWKLHLDASRVLSGGKSLHFFADILKYNGVSTTTIQRTQLSQAITSTDTVNPEEIDLDVYIVEQTISATDRIVVQWYAVPQGSGANPTGAYYIQGATQSRLELPYGTVDIASLVPYTGATNNVNLGTYGITATKSTTTYATTTDFSVTGTFRMLGQFFANLPAFVTYIQTLITENITGLVFSGGQLSLDAGYEITKTASSSNWELAYASTTALTPAYLRGLFSSTATGLTYTSATGVTSLTSGYEITKTASSSNWEIAFASTTAMTPTYHRGLFSNTATGLTYTSATGVTSLTANYIIPLSASTTNWNTFYDTPSNRITAGTGLSWSTNTLNIPAYLSLGNGFLYTGTTTDYFKSGYFVATTTTATSTIAGNLGIGTTTAVTSRLTAVSVSGSGLLKLITSTGTKVLEMLDTGVTTLLGTWDFSGATVKQHTYHGFTWPAGSATTTTATSTVYYGSAYTAESWNGMDCKVTSGTGAIIVSDGTNLMNGATATTTFARTTLSTNNTFTAQESRQINVGPLTASQITCSFDITVNN